MYYIGCDFGWSNDFTAIALIERVRLVQDRHTDKPRPVYHLRLLERPALGTSFPMVVDRLRILTNHREIVGNYRVLADKTGLGKPVVDMLKAAGIRTIPVTITAGHSVTTDEASGFNVPKQDIVATLVMLTQTGRLKIAQGLELAGELLEELQGFRLKVNLDTAHESYEAEAGTHDDLVIAVALACWYAERDPTISRISTHQDGKPIWQEDEEANEYDPLANYRG